MKLWTYWRSSAAYRVRIALALKGVAYEQAPVHLVRSGGEQHAPAYRAVQPQGLVPALEDEGRVLVQSLAILEYLEERHPEPPLLPRDPGARARVRGLAQLVVCEIHPLNNLRVHDYLRDVLGQAEDARTAWYRHWVALGLDAFERLVAASPETGRFCHGDAPTFADCCLVPQLYNARRFGCDLGGVPTLVRIDAACRELSAFEQARPENQPDAQ